MATGARVRAMARQVSRRARGEDSSAVEVLWLVWRGTRSLCERERGRLMELALVGDFFGDDLNDDDPEAIEPRADAHGTGFEV